MLTDDMHRDLLREIEELQLSKRNNHSQAKDAIRFLEMGFPAEALQICKEILNRTRESL